MKKKLWSIGLFLGIMSNVYGMDYRNNVPELSLAKNVLTSVLGVGTLLYGSWNGMIYGMQWSLSSNDSISTKPKFSDVLRKVVAPLATSIGLIVTGFGTTPE